jgi:hypothetical protein
VLWIAEGRGESVAAGDKVAFSSARLVSQVGTFTQIIAVQWAAECAKRVLRHYEDRYPEDKRPREAIQAALKWAKDPTEANRNAAAYAAADAAYAYAAASAAAAVYAAAANAAATNATNAAYAAASAAYADAAATAAATAAASAANAAAAASAAAYAADAASAYAADAAYAAAYAAASAADDVYADAAAYAADADARKKEREWQSDRLLKLLGAL